MQKSGRNLVWRPSGKTMRNRFRDTSTTQSEHSPHSGMFWVCAALVLFAVTAAYSNHFFNGFHFDDYHTIVNNSYIRSLRNIPLFFTDATTFSSLPANQSYRPLVTTTLALDYFMGNGNVFFFHLSTFVLFLVQGVVLHMLYSHIFDRSERSPANSFIALAAVAWYLLHPANAETINYVIARSDSLSTLFILLAFTVYLFWDFGRRRYLYLIPFALACLAKPVGAVFAPLFFLYSYLFEESDGTILARTISALKKSSPAIFASLFFMIFIRTMDPPTWKAGGASAFHYIITQPFVILHYFTTFFAPLSLSADTDWTTLPSLLDVRFFIGSLFLAGILAIAVITAKSVRLRPIAFGIFWFLITLLPTSLIPLAEVMNDHRLFLPYIGLTISFSWTMHLILARGGSAVRSKERLHRITAIVITAVLAVYAYGTHVRNDVWRTDETLWKDVTIKSPKNGRGLMNYGLALMARKDYENAEKYFREALKLTPNYSYLYVNLGIVKAASGQTDEAEPYFHRALVLDPGWPGGYYFYADFLKQQKRYDEAIRYAQKTLQMAPAHLDARKLLMEVYLESGRLSELRTLAEQTLLIAPDDTQTAAYRAAAEKGMTGLQ